ncbi:MAG: hypothetical protein ABI742_14850 [Gemmatimonadota bacterium]
MATTPADRSAIRAATAASAAMVAFQLAGKATRDALYLSTYDVMTLPRMVIAAALLSALLTIAVSRVMARLGPARVVPPLFGVSALLLLVEAALAQRFRATAVVLFYLHFSALGALLVSGFWAMVTDRFDPRAARATIGRITTGASIGGLAGGLLAAPLGAALSLTGILPVLALLHLVAAVLVLGVRPSGGDRDGEPRHEPGQPVTRAREAFRNSAYLRLLVGLVILTTMIEGMLDWAFKARLFATAPSGQELLRFFALFYTVTALLGILLQSTLLRAALARLGYAKSAALLPAGVSIGAFGGLLLPGLAPLLVARGTEIVLRNSLFRGAYELLFTPVPPSEKRATKLLVDVGATRLGDMAGGVLVQAALLLAVGPAVGPVLGLTIAVALGTLLITRRLHIGYPAALARSLAFRADQLPLVSNGDSATLLQTVGGFDLGQFRQRAVEPPAPAAAAPAPDSAEGRLAALHSRDVPRVEEALKSGPLSAALVDAAIGLLAWDPVARAAITALAAVAPAVQETLIRHLLDPEEDFAIRRRVVRVLAECPSPEVFDALLRALGDRRFEVRYLAGRAIYRQSAAQPELAIDRERVLQSVLAEVAVGRGVWESRQLIDAADDAEAPMEIALLRDRADRSLEHVFTLLALILPREPLRLAFHSLHTEDRHLRGTALEYLERVIPSAVRERLWPYLEPEESGAARTRRSSEAIVADLLQSRESIVLALAEVRRRADPTPS